MPQRPFGPPEDPDRFDDWEECVDALTEDGDHTQEEAERICGAWKDETEGNAMTDDDTGPEHRSIHHATGDLVTFREQEGENGDGTMTIRLPIASTGEVRNEGDDPLTRDELEGMAEQLGGRQVGVFPAHGMDDTISGGRYSPFEKLGDWQAGEVQARDADGEEREEALLFAEAVMPDPETLPAATGEYRKGLAIIKEQAKRGMTISSSIGWKADENSPGGNDLMEASIVGIAADPRTTTAQDATVNLARAVGASRPDADPEALVAAFRDVVMGPDTDDMSTDTNDTADTTDEQPDDQQAEDSADAETSERDETRDDTPEWASRMMDVLEDIHTAVREDDMDDDGDEDDDDGEEEQAADVEDAADAETESEQAADGDEESYPTDSDSDSDRGVTIDGEEVTLEEIREMRAELGKSTPKAPSSGDETDDGDTDTREGDSPDLADKYGITGI